MAAGLGFKDFVTGEVLTAADVDGYLMQGIWVFASAAARDAAVTSPQEGNACYLKDTNQVLTYSGSAWVAVGGGSPLTTKGDIYGFSTVDARIPIGANNTVLTADSSQALGLKWAAPAGGGGFTKITSATFSTVSNVSFATDTFTSTYKDYKVILDITAMSSSGIIYGRLRTSGTDNTTTNYFYINQQLGINGTQYNEVLGGTNVFKIGNDNTSNRLSADLTFLSPQTANKTKILGNVSGLNNDLNNITGTNQTLIFDTTTVFDSFTFICGTGTFSGRYAVYGLEA